MRWGQSATLTWPVARSWCTATEIDRDCALVACSETVAAAIVADERVEAFVVDCDDHLSRQSDLVNPCPDRLT